MRTSTKLTSVAVVAIGIAGASPFFVDYVGLAAGIAPPVVTPTADAAFGVTTGVQVAQATTPAKPTTTAPSTTAKPATTAPAATAPAAAQPTLSQGDLQLVVTLLRNTLVALNQANLTGNYTVLRDLGAPGFRDANTAAALGDIFAPIRSRGIDLSTAVLLDPQLTLAKINDNGMLDIAGSLATQPASVKFEMLYQGVQNTWQLFGISIAPDTPAQASNTPTTATPTAPATSGTKPATGVPVPATRP